MKRRILIAALALVLAVGGIVRLNSSLAAAALPIEFEVLASRGDASAAEGLAVDYRIALGNSLRWYSLYEPASHLNDTVFTMTYREDHPNLVGQYVEDPWRLACKLLDGSDENDPIVRCIRKKLDSTEGQDNAMRIYPFDFYDVYPSVITTRENASEDILCHSWNDMFFDFPQLQVPVGENDFFEMWFYDNKINGKYSLSVTLGNYYRENRYTPYSLGLENGMLAAVGFAADVQPSADWAPEGFGLWYIPLREQERVDRSGWAYLDDLPVVDECRVVYPLDIETQRVALLEQSGDGRYILLVTVEEGRCVLHVLDSADYHLVQRLDIDEAEPRGSSSTAFYMDDRISKFGDFRPVDEEWSGYRINPAEDGQKSSVTCEYLDYPTVGMRQGDNFLVMTIGSRMALLTPDGKGYRVEFVCDVPDFCYMVSEDPSQNGYRFLDQEERDEMGSCEMSDVFSTMDVAYTMAYNGRQLAAAYYIRSDGLMLLSVYGPGGLQYAEVCDSSLLKQMGTGDYSWGPLWQDRLMDDQDLLTMWRQPDIVWKS